MKNERSEQIESGLVYDLLYRVGLQAKRTFFFHTAYAVTLAAQRPELLRIPAMELYPAVAEQYDTSAAEVAKSVRTALSIVWRNKREALCALTDRPLSHRPREAEFLAVLAEALLSGAQEGAKG